MDLRLEMVHLQLTRQCNLNCWFCGQRKNLGDRDEIKALGTEEWLKVVTALDGISRRDAVAKCNPKAKFAPAAKPSVMLWGGEPLISPGVDEIAHVLHNKGYQIGMVTNGTLLDRHEEMVSQCLKKIYVSIDGPEPLHDSIRGNGTFQKIKDNLRLIEKAAPHIPIVCMAVLTETLKEQLPTFLDALSDFPINELLLQDMIWLSEEEIGEYRNMMSREFSVDADEIKSWRVEGEKTEKTAAKTAAKTATKKSLEAKLSTAECSCIKINGKYPFKVQKMPHAHIYNIKKQCLSPYRHLHIMWNGETSFCTDFTDFSLGNVRERKLGDLFKGERAEKFRELVKKGSNPTCRHCSWVNKHDFYDL